MCGIVGSFDRKDAFRLYEKNLERGRHSAGLLVITSFINCLTLTEYKIIKTPSPFNIKNIPDGCLYLFHSRAPTGRSLEYQERDTHPFHVNGVYVAHNGIITNAKKLSEEFKIDYTNNNVSNVDSYVIPHIIYAYMALNLSWRDTTWLESILYTLNRLEGTFGLWIYIPGENLLYICRRGSTLYYDPLSCSFSSSPQEGFKLLPEGILYQLKEVHNTEPTIQWVEVGNFENKPMYYIV